MREPFYGWSGLSSREGTIPVRGLHRGVSSCENRSGIGQGKEDAMKKLFLLLAVVGLGAVVFLIARSLSGEEG
jgi:hypothetical protein